MLSNGINPRSIWKCRRLGNSVSGLLARCRLGADALSRALHARNEIVELKREGVGRDLGSYAFGSFFSTAFWAMSIWSNIEVVALKSDESTTVDCLPLFANSDIMSVHWVNTNS